MFSIETSVTSTPPFAFIRAKYSHSANCSGSRSIRAIAIGDAINRSSIGRMHVITSATPPIASSHSTSDTGCPSVSSVSTPNTTASAPPYSRGQSVYSVTSCRGASSGGSRYG